MAGALPVNIGRAECAGATGEQDDIGANAHA
jgi:hypothetical protein